MGNDVLVSPYCIAAIVCHRVSGVPSANYKLPSEWIKPGAIVVNVSSFKNVDEEALLKVRAQVVLYRSDYLWEILG